MDRILIVDDSSTSRLIIRRCFEMLGFGDTVIVEAEDGFVGLDLLSDLSYDMIVTDINMPKMDGKTFLKKIKIRKETQDIPVMVITSQGDDETSDTLLRSGAQVVMPKPVSPAKLKSALERMRRRISCND